MLKFGKFIDDRKVLVKRLEELTGEQAVYTRMPRCAYEIGAYTVEKDGSLSVDEEQELDPEVVATLLFEGLINPIHETDEERFRSRTSAGQVPENSEMQEQNEEMEPTGEIEETVTGQEPETEISEDEDLTDTVEEPADEDSEADGLETDEPDGGNGEEIDEEVAENSEEADETDDGTEDSEDTADEEPPGDTAPEATPPTDYTDLAVSVPLTKYNGVKLRNLFNLVYSRGPIINRAIGANFYVSEELIEYLKDDNCTYTVKNFTNALEEFALEHPDEEHVKGIEITEDKVILTGFPADFEGERIEAYMHLAELMHQQALMQKRIMAKVVDDTNEKYAMRIWLIRIGMKGDEYKDTRRILMENLSGQPAFRREEDAARFFEKEKRKRDAARAARKAEAAAKRAAEKARIAEAEIMEAEIAEAAAQTQPEDGIDTGNTGNPAADTPAEQEAGAALS